MTDWNNPDSRESAMAAKWAEAEDKIRVLEDHLQFVERWANHHASKPHTTPQEALSVIQHYPPIKAITKAYADGKVPDTTDPYEQIRVLREALELIRGQQDDHAHDIHEARAIARDALEATK